MLKGVLHRIEDDLDAQDVHRRADVLAGFEQLLQRHADFDAYLDDEAQRHP